MHYGTEVRKAAVLVSNLARQIEQEEKNILVFVNPIQEEDDFPDELKKAISNGALVLDIRHPVKGDAAIGFSIDSPRKMLVSHYNMDIAQKYAKTIPEIGVVCNVAGGGDTDAPYGYSTWVFAEWYMRKALRIETKPGEVRKVEADKVRDLYVALPDKKSVLKEMTKYAPKEHAAADYALVYCFINQMHKNCISAGKTTFAIV